MRTKRYKLILFYGTSGWEQGYGHDRTKVQSPPAWELYDLKNDPNETTNLYDNPEYASIIEELKKQFRELRHDIKADDASVAASDTVRTRIENSNTVIDEFWDYDDEDRARAIEIAKAYADQFANPSTGKDKRLK
jgi:hypothetical protein